MNMFRRTVSAVTLATLISTSIPAHAAIELMEDELDNRPSAGAAIADAAIARPLMLAGTIGGTAVFVVSLPFTVLSGKVKESADMLVVRPANATFRRCLGCSIVQDDRKHSNEMQSTAQQ